MTLRTLMKNVLIMSFFSATVYGGPIETLNPGEWYQVPNSHIRSVLPNPLPPGNGPESIVGAWNGGAYDTKRDRYIVWGGGHNDYGGNEIYTFDINTLAWSRTWGPSPNIPPTNGPCNLTYPDGNPVSRHTYDGLEYLPTVDKFWILGGSLYCGGGGAGGDSWVFDFAVQRWTRMADFPSSAQLEMVSGYDPLTGHVFVNGPASSNSLLEYNPMSNTWINRNGDGVGYHKVAAIDPWRRKMVAIGEGIAYVYNLTASGTILRQNLNTAGATEILSAYYPGFDYDPVSNRLVAYSGGAFVYSLNLDTNVWTKISPAASNTVTPTPQAGSGTYGRFRYIPSKNAFIVVNSIDEDVYIYKLTAGNGTTDTTPPTVAISTPVGGASITGTVTVSSTVTDNIGVAGVQFIVDGTNIGSDVLASPYSIPWNTTLISNGSHSLTAMARDMAGNLAVSSPVTVTVSNSAKTPKSPTNIRVN